MNFRLDARLRDSETRIRRILDNDSQVTGGQKCCQFNSPQTMTSVETLT